MANLDRLNTGLGVMAVLYALYIAAALVLARVRDARSSARRAALRRQWIETRRPQGRRSLQSPPSSDRSR